MANIFSLYGSIFIDNEKANKAIDDTTKKGKNSAKTFGEKFGETAKTVGKVATGIVTTATAVVTGFTAMASKTADYAGSINDASKKTSINTDLLQQLKYAGEQSGVSFEDLTSSATKFNRVFADASTGNKNNIQTFKDLGIAIKDSSGNARASSDVYNDVIMKLASMGDTAEANALGNDIFGKSFANLKPLLSEGADGIQAFKDKANELGIVMSEDSVVAGDNFADTMDTIKASLGGAFNKVMSSLMPVIQKLLDLIIKNMPTIQKLITDLAPVLTNTLEIILPVFTDLAEMLLPLLLDVIKQLLPPIMQIIQELLPIFTKLLAIILPPLIKIIQQLLPVLLPIIEAVLPLLTPVFKMLSWGIDTILMPIINTLTKIIDFIGKGLAVAIKLITPIIEGLGDIFKKVFGGLWNIVKAPINLIIDGINLFIKAVNKIKLPDWDILGKYAGKGFNFKVIPKLAKGLDYVPYDEFPALLHKGERVLTAKENSNYSGTNEKQVVNNFNNTIQIDKLEVRDDKDIDRIAESLYYLQQKKAVN